MFNSDPIDQLPGQLVAKFKEELIKLFQLCAAAGGKYDPKDKEEQMKGMLNVLKDIQKSLEGRYGGGEVQTSKDFRNNSEHRKDVFYISKKLAKEYGLYRKHQRWIYKKCKQETIAKKGRDFSISNFSQFAQIDY